VVKVEKTEISHKTSAQVAFELLRKKKM